MLYPKAICPACSYAVDGHSEQRTRGDDLCFKYTCRNCKLDFRVLTNPNAYEIAQKLTGTEEDKVF